MAGTDSSYAKDPLASLDNLRIDRRNGWRYAVTTATGELLYSATQQSIKIPKAPASKSNRIRAFAKGMFSRAGFPDVQVDTAQGELTLRLTSVQGAKPVKGWVARLTALPLIVVTNNKNVLVGSIRQDGRDYILFDPYDRELLRMVRGWRPSLGLRKDDKDVGQVHWKVAWLFPWPLTPNGRYTVAFSQDFSRDEKFLLIAGTIYHDWQLWTSDWG